MGSPNACPAHAAQDLSALMQPQKSNQQRESFISNDRAGDRIRNMHDVLSDPHRCAILDYLQKLHGPVDVCEVAEQVPKRNLEAQVDEEGADQARKWLLESHILLMDEFGLIRYDREQDTIRLPDDVSITLPPHWNE